MKTLIFTLSITFTFLFSLTGIASTNTGVTEKSSIYSTSLNVINLSNIVLEEDLIIEAWMIDDSHWNNSTNDIFMVEEEGSLEIENWMTDNENWKAPKSTQSKVSIIETENGDVYVFKMKKVKEEVLQIEKWMTDDKYWSL